MLEFLFPEYEEELATVKDASHLKALLGQYQRKFKGQVCYTIRLRKEKYLYAQCKHCRAHLNYQKSTSSTLFELKKFSSQHSHTYHSKKKQQQIKALMQDLPETINTKAAKAIALHEVAMTKSQFYYYWNRIKQPTLSFTDFMEYLEDMKYEVQSEPFSPTMHQPPDLFIVVTPLMKQMFIKYGEAVSFDLTFNVVKDIKDQRSWKLGVLACLSHSKHILPVALVLTTELTKNCYSKIFKAIWDIMGKCPKVVMSDEEAAVGSALQDLKDMNEFDGQHCHDLFHILRNVKAKLKNKQHLRYFSRLGRAEDEFEFEKILEEAFQAVEPEEIQLLKRFVNKRHSYCFAYLPDAIGLSSSTNINEKFHDILKEKVTVESSFTKAVLQTLKICNRLLSVGEEYTVQKLPIEEFLGISQLREIRYTVDKSIFKVYCEQFSKIIHLEVFPRDEDFEVINLKTKRKYVVVNLECSCRYRQKTGIACSHLIKIYMLKQLRLSTTIDERWKVQVRPVNKRSNKIGRRHTRKRRRH